MSLTFTRRFTLEDQTAFATLSGDWNPLHVDPIAARRTLFGAPVVHGAHLALWALETTLGESMQALQLDTCRAAFRRPAYLEQPMTTQVIERHDDSVQLVSTMDGACVLELTARFGRVDRRRFKPSSRRWAQRESPVDVEADALRAARGTVEAALDPDLALQMFPALATHWDDVLSELLASTRIVGMLCPGLHSVYAGFDLRHSETGATAVSYRVANTSLKYSLATLQFDGPTLTGTLKTFVRPRPSPRLSMAAVQRAVTAGEFASQRALVVGGSRGLGEAFAKAIAAGGGDVCVTYQRGRDDAESVCADIQATGSHARAVQLDVRAFDNVALEYAPTHVYYFATPFIKIDKTRTFDTEMFELYCQYYVTAFHRLVEWVARRAPHATVWAPSTEFLDGAEPGTAAYCSAKAAMEELGRHLSKRLPIRVLTPRLPRTATDQTVGLIPTKTADPVDIALACLRSIAQPNIKNGSP